jgi:hypothetical protein
MGVAELAVTTVAAAVAVARARSCAAAILSGLSSNDSDVAS